jgi:hypothetical protein
MSFSSKVGARHFLAGARGSGLEGGVLAVAWLERRSRRSRGVGQRTILDDADTSRAAVAAKKTAFICDAMKFGGNPVLHRLQRNDK